MTGWARPARSVTAGVGKALTSIHLTNSVAAGNLVGLRADGNPSAIVVGGSTLTSNITNLVTATGGGVGTWGNNYQDLNGTTNPFSFPVPPQ